MRPILLFLAFILFGITLYEVLIKLIRIDRDFDLLYFSLEVLLLIISGIIIFTLFYSKKIQSKKESHLWSKKDHTLDMKSNNN
ncbi:hypothetical protein [Flavobacterium sp. '19STA2R22 D10 B1']|uniref:hypothetical protein n=1 Tax=Flavobacterium aerium TaxID=3037261 RepID=UPI00278C2826|nr:hypothetical protein [Flavobacterium sp. '19STA2R22 D10 B1']